ncbi:phytanoyl-CoA dioxygenase family protein [Parasphingorhabdus sp. NYA22]
MRIDRLAGAKNLKNRLPEELHFDRSALGTPEAVKRFEQAGCLQIANFLPEAKIAALAKDAAAILGRPVAGSQSIQVGTKRQMISVPIDGAFNDGELYAPQELDEFFSLTLGDRYLLSCFTCVAAKPGAPNQHLHQDYAGLFDSAIDGFSPSFAINLFVPLVSLNGVNGTTRIWPYSHRKPDRGGEANKDDWFDPQLEPGSALLLDYRVLHGGTANLSPQIRPILCLAYSRDWFLDSKNFQDVNPLQVDADVLEKMEPRYRRLFKRAELYRKSDRI